MIALLRNCSHGSEIAAYSIQEDGLNTVIIKVASTKHGIENLHKEVDGWNWYQNVIEDNGNNKLARVLIEKNKYLKISIPYIDGLKANYNDGLVSNADLISKVIRQYVDLWPYKEGHYSPLHGDLSIDNIIYNQQGVHIIDWEHFAYDGAPWGFDALYLVFETLWFGMKDRITLTSDEAIIIKKCIKMLNKQNRLPTEMIESPLGFVKKYMVENMNKWGEQMLNYPNKFPVLKFANERIVAIDNRIFRC
jgi:hypothetical protein